MDCLICTQQFLMQDICKKNQRSALKPELHSAHKVKVNCSNFGTFRSHFPLSLSVYCWEIVYFSIMWCSLITEIRGQCKHYPTGVISNDFLLVTLLVIAQKQTTHTFNGRSKVNWSLFGIQVTGWGTSLASIARLEPRIDLASDGGWNKNVHRPG